ncbi:hypothetical protein [Streptomyces acidiscabies]|uniref:Uncharacterized protein n=1 Tax=Streptomyces acidiscabies TaxID=42234 RepID=A0AAP6ELK1_9ACTN|nr:hypothetical protein [Streptomyces acidiscabies]MBZ3918205.1 hypothetical protein [Streptomyces acidiscabies]MDX2967113.1 hypothetical protein [Streptomyces acidiscabies]MDX3788364.1 hypothetical protein [Streptomyces acidiscabies]
MTFPMAVLDVRIDLLVGGVWQDVTADVYTRTPMTITRGRPDEGARTDPGKLSLTFNNGRSKVNPAVSGRYSSGNPLSDLYGKIGRNTPVRVHVPAASAHLALDGDPAGYMSTPHSAALNITSDIDVRVEWDADTTDTARNQQLIGKWSSTATERAWVLRYWLGSIEFGWRDSGGATLGAVMPAGLYGGGALRATLDVDDGAGGLAVRFYQADALAGPWTQISVTTAAVTTSIQSTSSSDLRIGPSDPTVTPPRVPVIGTVTRAQVRAGIDGTLVADLDVRALADGASGVTDSVGRVWTVNGTAKIRKRADRFVGEISSWPPRWDVSGNDRWVSVEAAGVLRRYGRPGSPLDSTLRRRIPSGNPLAYWPMEEGALATQAYSPIPGVAPMKVTGLTFASADTLPGSSALPVLGQSASLQANVPSSSATGWHVEMVYRLDTLPATLQQIARVRVTGAGMAAAVVLASSSGIRIEVRDADDAVTAGFTFTTADAIAAFAGVWNRLQIYTSVSGGTTNVHAAWRNILTNSYWVAQTSYTGTPGRPTQIIGSWGSAYQGMAIGHLAVWTGVAAGLASPFRAAITTYESADDGFIGEAAGRRMVRLAGEETIPLSVRGIVAEQEEMGAQRPLQMLEVLEQAADTDGGILSEHRGRLALRYRGRGTLYNQAPAVTLRYSTAREIAPPLEPITDDADTTNDVTVTRIDGSSARVVQDTGPLSVTAIGRYDTSVQLSLATDDQAAPIAGWRLYLGTQDTPRYPVVHVDLAAAPHLIPAVLGIDQGDVIRLTGLPADLPPGDVDLIVQGYTETLDQYAWDAYFTCTPAAPWSSVGALVYDENFEDTTYEIPYTNGGNLPWVRTNTQAHTGSWSLRSGAITHNQISDAIVAVPAGMTEMRVWYWTSSEAAGAGFLGDRLIILVDGVQVLTAQGTTPWTQAVINVTGKSAVTFRYAKDNSTSTGSDMAAIDNLSFTGPPCRVDADGSTLAAGVSSTATTLSVAGPLWITSSVYPQEFPFDARLGGEVVRVTAVSGASSPQTWTVVRSVNGIVKAQVAGEAVSLAVPAYTAL